MSATIVAAPGPPNPNPISRSPRLQSQQQQQQPRIPGVFQLLLALYILLTSSFPTILQAIAFGVQGGAGSEFAAAMATEFVRSLLLLLPILVLSNHRLGILHPLLMAVVVWPLISQLPQVIQDLGGWGGVLVGLPVNVPFYLGLPSHSPTTVWMATAKYNTIEIIALLCTYAGFWLFKVRPKPRLPLVLPDSRVFQGVLLSLIGLSLLVLLAFVYSRGGIIAHVTSLGLGRFRELSGAGPIIVASRLGTIALYLWIAARPDDAKSPIFLACLAAITVTQFISNGSRSRALEVPMVAGVIWALRKQRVPWRTALILAPFLFVSLGLLGAVRSSTWTGQDAGEVWSSTGIEESLLHVQQELEGRRAISAQIPIVARGFEVTGGPMLGSTYMAALGAIVPRTIWEDKPRGPGSLYAQMFLGASSEAFGTPVAPPTEMYWNFGIGGVLLLSLLYGALIRIAYNAFWRRFPSPFAVVFFALFLTGFKIGTIPLVDFEQSLGLLGVCYIATFLVPRRKYAVAKPRGRFAPGAAAMPAAGAALQ